MKTIETERLTLRPWQETDVDDMFEYARDPEVGPNAGWPPHASREVSAQIIRKFIEQGDVWAIVWKETGKVIGSVGLHTDQRRPGVNCKMLGYVLSRDYWGRGLMTEAAGAAIRYAFDELKLDLLSVCHFPHNSRSRRVIEKCGFQYEGVFRMAWKFDESTAVDDVSYSMLRSEYEQTRSSLAKAHWD